MTNAVASSAKVEDANGTVPQVKKNREIRLPLDFSAFNPLSVGVKQRLMQENPTVSVTETSTESLLSPSQLVIQLREAAAQIESMMAQNSELGTSVNRATSAKKTIRDVAWHIFNATGKFIGRNTDEAIEADTRALVRRLAVEERLPRYDRAVYGNIMNWKAKEIDTVIDPDMAEASLSLVVYRHLDIDILSRVHAILDKQDAIKTRDWQKTSAK